MSIFKPSGNAWRLGECDHLIVSRFEKDWDSLSRPYVVGDASSHIEGEPERLSNAPEIVVNKVQRGGMGAVFDFLFERVH